MMSAEREVVLPVGVVHGAGGLSRRAAVRKMRGHEEALLYDASLTSGRLVTQLLAGCLTRLGDETEVTPPMVARMFSADRHFLLLEIRRFTLGDALPCFYVCPGCGADVGVVEDLATIEIRRYAGDAPPPPASLALQDGYRDRDGEHHHTIRLRLPRGDDEEFISDVADRDPLRARDALVLRCIEAFGTLSRAALEAYGVTILRDLTLSDRRTIYRALDADAPGLDFRRALRCEACGTSFESFLEASRFFLLD